MSKSGDENPNMSPETVAAQRAVFEQVLKAAEGYLLALTRAIYCNAIHGEMPSEVVSNLNTTRKLTLDFLQATLMSKL